MAKVKEVAPKKDEKKVKVAETKKVEAKKAVEKPASEMTFEEKVAKNEEFQAKKRKIKTRIEAAKKIENDVTVFEISLKQVQNEERKWLESFAKMLEPEIKKNGFIYKLFKRGEKTLIYAQHDKRDAEDGGGISETPIAYEVFLSKISPPKIAFKKPYDAYEMFPGNGVFGIWAWTCSTIERAEERFTNLEKGDIAESEADSDEE